MEQQAAINSGQIVVAKEDGEVVNVTGDTIVVVGENGPLAFRSIFASPVSS
jgi:hypothetical protein